MPLSNYADVEARISSIVRNTFTQINSSTSTKIPKTRRNKEPDVKKSPRGPEFAAGSLTASVLPERT
ncbi:unnamed protein product [Hymenolepis diminuta]|uniref:Uncharacterized protein n=1 Tax=Hymenolepis diminuta TaxID=6216 RepID=A0A0R3SSX9_HYMDI|nr:unnamed protein product [Hymenolepis diminuta]